MQELLQSPVAGRIVGGVHGLVILAEELGAFTLWQVPENYFRVIRVLNLSGLSGHTVNPTPLSTGY